MFNNFLGTIKKYTKPITEYIKKHKILLILILGLIIRLVLMPFFTWKDLISTYQRAYEVTFNGENLLNYGQPLSHLIEVINLYIYDIFFKSNHLLPLSRFKSENPYVNFNLFFFKLPYLIFDILSFFILKGLIKNKKSQVISLAFYFLNPILIFSVYMFGRYETFPIAFLLISLYFIKKNKFILSTFTFSLAILSRTSFIILAPIYFILIGKNFRQKILISILTLLPFVFTVIYKVIILNNLSGIKWLLDGHHVNFLLGSKLESGVGTNIYPFIISYSVTIYFAIKDWILNKSNWEKCTFYLFITLAQYYSLCYFHPQYLSWIIPLIAILLANIKNKTEILILNIVISLLFIPLLLCWGNNLLFSLAYPISDNLGSIDISGKISEYYDPIKLSNIAKSIISACFILQIYNLISNKKIIKKKSRNID